MKIKIVVESAKDGLGRQRFTMFWKERPRMDDKLDPRPLAERGNRAQCFHAVVSDYVRRHEAQGDEVEVVG